MLGGLIIKDFEKPKDIVTAKKLDIIGNLKQRKHHVLEQAYDALSSERRKFFSRIACFRGAIDFQAIRAVAENPDTFQEDLRDFIERELIHHTEETNQFDLHPIVRRYAYERLTTTDRTGAHERLVDYFETVPKPEKVKTLEDLAPVIELYHHMVRAWNLDEALKLYYDRLQNAIYFQFGAYQLEIELLYALFLDGEDKPPRLKNENAQTWTLNTLATSYSLSGQPRRAVPLFEMQNAICEKAGDKLNLAIGLLNVAHTTQIYIGALSAAERNLRQMMSLTKEIKDELRQARGHQELGRVLSYRGSWPEARQELDKSLEVAEKQYHVQMQSLIWSYCALRFLLMSREKVNSNQSSVKNVKSAIECAGRALELADETTKTRYSYPRDYVRAYWLLGTAYSANNELVLAEENLSKALNLCRQINMVESEADILLDFARLHYAQGDFKDAQEKASEALVITERSGYVLQGADVHLFLAQFALEQEKDKVKAKELAEKAKELAYCDGPPYYYKVAYEEAERLLEGLR